MVEVLRKLQGVGGDERRNGKENFKKSFLLIINEIPFDFSLRISGEKEDLNGFYFSLDWTQ